MNGRLYDPILHRFLAPDNYVQDPFNTQNFNRYGYVLNNPLLYTDPSGEFWHIVIGAVVGGVVNLATNWDNIDNFWEGVAAFGVGAGAGALVAATGGAGAGFFATAGVSSLAGAATMSTNSIIEQTGNGTGLGDVHWGRVGEGALIGAVTGFAGGASGHWAANSSMLMGGFDSPLSRVLTVAPLTATAGHLAGGTTAGVLRGKSLDDAFTDAVDGVGPSMLMGMAVGVVSAVGASYANGINPVTGKKIPVKAGTLARYSGILRDAAKFKRDFGLGKGTASEAMELGKAWVGKGYRVSGNGKAWISRDGLRQFQTYLLTNPRLGIDQANFQWRNAGQKEHGKANGHLDIFK